MEEIIIKENLNNFIADLTTDDLDKIDIEATKQEYAKIVKNIMAVELPNNRIIIEWSDFCSGIYTDDLDVDPYEVQNILDNIFNYEDFWVLLSEEK